MKLFLFLTLVVLSFGIPKLALCQWTAVARPFLEEPHPPGGGTAAFAALDSTIFAGGYAGVFASTDAGTTWDSAGLAGSDIYALLAEGETLLAGAHRYNSGLFRSSNRGAAWTRVDSAVISSVQGLAKIDNVLFAGASSSSQAPGGGIFRSTDDGQSWALTSAPYTNILALSFARIGSSYFASINGGVLRSTDGGVTWTLPNDSGLQVSDMLCLATIDTVLFAGSARGIIYSNDKASTWDTAYKGDMVISLISVGRNLFGGTKDLGVILSTNGGKTWTVVNDGMGEIRINALLATGAYLFAGDESGKIWRRSVTEFLEVSHVHELQEEVTVSPNPTSGITKIRRIPALTNHITVMNSLGERVSDLSIANTSEFTIDLSKFAPGLYLARLTAPSSEVTIKIIKEQ